MRNLSNKTYSQSTIPEEILTKYFRPLSFWQFEKGFGELHRCVWISLPSNCHMDKELLDKYVYPVINSVFRMKLIQLPLLRICCLAFICNAIGATFDYVPSDVKPPVPQREFRGGWVATVANIDWPSKPGLPVAQQKSELIEIMDKAAKLNLNAVVFQVRPACDTMYASKIEPWAYYLTGAMGKPPEPFYDPLSLAVEEAHKRGMELHAWFNPYRAWHPSDKGPTSPKHISKTHPEMVVKYGKHLWLDPSQKTVQDYSLNVVMDVVKRYDIDGVHFDDYFYPYKETNAQGAKIDFPDDSSWQKYVSSGGKLSRADWRRQNVDTFVQRVYQSIKATKPSVKFGIAPFGIWQPGNPAQIKGFNAYDELYCDSLKWLTNGWIDYCAPQLYWAIAPKDQSYPVLLKWWLDNNPKQRNIWPGINTGNVVKKWKSEEIENQIKISREQSSGKSGVIHWSMKSLMRNSGNLASNLESGLYSEPALVPAFPYLSSKAPSKPKVAVSKTGTLSWPTPSEKIAVWVFQSKSGDKWKTQILPSQTRSQSIPEGTEAVALTAVDRNGLASPVTVLAKRGDISKKD